MLKLQIGDILLTRAASLKGRRLKNTFPYASYLEFITNVIVQEYNAFELIDL